MYLQFKNGYKIDIINYSDSDFSTSLNRSDISTFLSNLTIDNLTDATIYMDSGDIKTYKLIMKLISVSIYPKTEDDENVVATASFETVDPEIHALQQFKEKIVKMLPYVSLGLQYCDLKSVIDMAEFLPDWEPDMEYKKGYRVQYHNKPYLVTSDHKSDGNKTPDKTSAFYKLITEETINNSEPQYEEWINGKEYQVGDKVTYKGDVWECTWSNNKREPGGLGWKKYQEN